MAVNKGKYKGKRVLDQFNKLWKNYPTEVWVLLHTTKTHLLVLDRVMGFANQETFLSWPSVSTLMHKCQLSKSTVKRILKELIQQGWLLPAGTKRFVCKNGWEQYVNVYKVTLDKGEAALVSCGEKISSEGSSSAKVGVHSDTKVGVQSEPLTCTTDNSVPHASGILHFNLPNLEVVGQVGEVGEEKVEKASLAEEMTTKEIGIQVRCYKLSSLKPCYNKTEHQLLRTLMKNKSLKHFHNLLDWIEKAETPQSRFWNHRFIFDQQEQPVKHPVQYFCKSYPTMIDQWDRQFFPDSFPVPTRATTTATPTTMDSSDAAALVAYFTIEDDDVLTEQEMAFHMDD
jgi:hypothetical protein